MERNITTEISLLRESVRTYQDDVTNCSPETVLAEALLAVGVARVAGNRRLACSTPLNRLQQRLETKLKYQFSDQELEQLLAFCTDEAPIECSTLIALLQLVPELDCLVFRRKHDFDPYV